ncbi:SsrA-binding protein SmpB [Streptomyces sp. NPDC058579]|uniref:SsrA-binding protein SmpB n=1 Tax=Streptomyces sp. NPDC058579 TaxID=3346548 RepID=UPI00365A760F
MAKGLVNVQGKPAKKKDPEKAPERKIIAQNKKARHDYHIIDTYECGVVLMGTEVKSLRMGRASLVDGFVQIDRGEAWLHNIHVPEYSQGSWTNHSAKRKRKLLLHRAEIDKLESKSQETGHTIVPLALYFLNGRVKVEIALAKGKKEYDKRQTLREKQDTRETSRAIAAAKRRQRAAKLAS